MSPLHILCLRQTLNPLALCCRKSQRWAHQIILPDDHLIDHSIGANPGRSGSICWTRGAAGDLSLSPPSLPTEETAPRPLPNGRPSPPLSFPSPLSLSRQPARLPLCTVRGTALCTLPPEAADQGELHASWPISPLTPYPHRARLPRHDARVYPPPSPCAFRSPSSRVHTRVPAQPGATPLAWIFPSSTLLAEHPLTTSLSLIRPLSLPLVALASFRVPSLLST